MQLVLATAATDAAVACGGATSADVQAAPPGAGDSGTRAPQPDPRKDPPKGRPSDGGIKDAGKIDAQADAAPDAFTPQPCVSGLVDRNPDFCCKDGDPACTPGSTPGSGDQCALDCAAVCATLAPGTAPAGQFCYWSASATNPTIAYACGMCGVGRIPEGTVDCERGSTIGERLAMQAYYEAVSVIAFRRLAEVLATSNAPPSLVRRVLAAAEDESRHAETFTRLARERGASVKAVIEPDERPTLRELAIENAREGCVRETYGALALLHQSSHADDADLRAAFATVAEDEIAHAELSWDLAQFFEQRLDESHSAHRAAALASLRVAAMREHDAVDRSLGIPAPAKARAMFDDLFARIAA